MFSWKPRTNRVILICLLLMALLGIYLPGIVSPKIGAYTSPASPLAPATGETALSTASASPPTGSLAPFMSQCISDSLTAGGPTYHRVRTQAAAPGFITPCQLTVGSTSSNVLYKTYEFTLTDCASTTLVANTCGTGACSGVGTLTDTVLYIYRKPGGAPAAPGSPIFDPIDPCANLVAANDDFCGSRSQVTTLLASGNFMVVVTGFGNTNTGSFNLSVDAPGCTLTPVTPCSPVPATPTITPTPATLAPGSTGNQASGPAGADSYLWSISNGAITSATNIQTITYTAPASGSVTLTLTVTNSAGCFATNSIDVPVVVSSGGGLCLSASLLNSDPTYHRAKVPITPCAPTVGTTSDHVFYDTYEFDMSGCASGTVTASLCGTGACSGTGTLADSVLFIYRKPDGSASGPGSPIFDPTDVCLNLVAGNDDFCGTLSQTGASFSAGHFVVVVTASANGGTGTYNLSVVAPGCSLTNTPPCPTITGTVSGDASICPSGSAVITVTLSGGTAPYTVTLNNGGGTQTGASPLMFTVSPAATTTYSVASGTDSAGCPVTGSGSATITVGDNTPPTITCPANITTSTDPNQCVAVVTYAIPVASDNCSSASVMCVPASGSAFPKGTTTVTCTATDASSNTASCSFNVTVNDTQPPTVTCPANVVTGTAPNQCVAVVNYVTPTASDNCPGATVMCAPPSGSAFPKGTTAVTCTATDTSSNTATCSFMVTVNDTQPPTITCPANVSVNNAPGLCSAVVAYPAPTVSDNCPGASAVCVPASGATFPVGTTTVTCTATDASGNQSTCAFTVTVLDAQPPTITTCPANRTLSTNGGNQIALPSLTGEVVATDNCTPSGSLVITQSPVAGTMIGLGTTNVTITVKDAANNTATCTVVVTVVQYSVSGFVAFSSEYTKLSANAQVNTGNVGANTSLPDPNGPPDDTEEVELGERVKMLQAGSSVVGDTVRLRANSQVYNVHYNESLFSNQAVILGNQVTPQSLPVIAALPAFPTITPGTTDIEVATNQSLTLAPGSYRNITVKTKGTLILTGGIYHILTLDIRQEAKLLFKGPSEMRIKNEMDTDAKTIIGPDASAPTLQASQIIFYVQGTDDQGHPADGDPNVTPTAVDIGERNTVVANIYAPNGTVKLRANTTATGAYIGKQVLIGERVELTLKSAF